jgi:hypothetical protein
MESQPITMATVCRERRFAAAGPLTPTLFQFRVWQDKVQIRDLTNHLLVFNSRAWGTHFLRRDDEHPLSITAIHWMLVEMTLGRPILSLDFTRFPRLSFHI